MPVSESQAFVGRADELDVFEQELAAARAGRPRVVLVDGPAGIGKTSLVERFAAAVRGARVIHASGEESEAGVELAMLDQLLRRAGAGAVDLAAGGHVEAGARLLDALSDLQANGTVIVVIDDAHWADATSLRALLFAIRRLVSDSVLLVIATREQAPGLEGLRKLTADGTVRHVRLAPLALAEVIQLADAQGVPLSRPAARRLHEQSGGSPLYARELLAEVPSNVWESPTSPLPAPRIYSELVLRRLQALPASAVALAESASVLGGRTSLAMAAGLAEAEDPYAAVDGLLAPQAALVELAEAAGGAELRFVHPLVRAAIYGSLAPSRRAALHRRAATVVRDEASALYHRFKAAASPDAALAGDLAEYAVRSTANQRWADAVRAFELAARATPHRADRERYVLAAIEAAMFGGDGPRARTLAEETRDFEPGPRLDAVLAYVCLGTGQRAEAEERLRRAWAQDPTSARVAQLLAFLSVIRLRAADAVEWARTALSLAAGDMAPATMWLATGLHWLGRRDEAYAVLEDQRERLDRGAGAIRGTMLLADGELSEAAADLAAAERNLRHVGSLIVTGRLLAKYAQVQFARGEWDTAVVLADRAQAFATESDDVAAEAIAGWAAALVPAARGEMRECERVRSTLEALPVVFEAHIAERNLGLAVLAAAGGRYEEVLRVLAPLAAFEAREAIDASGHFPWAHLFADALVRLGRPDARAFLERHETLAHDNTSRARLAYVRGELKLQGEDLAAAIDAFALAGQLLPAGAPYERALVDFGHGRALRRVRQRRAAAELLGRARDTFAALGARPVLDPCERELDACGLSPAKRGPTADRSRLTPQERSVAQLAAAGRSNREIAGELLISVKSVERYLTQVYRKLGVDARGDLASRLA